MYPFQQMNKYNRTETKNTNNPQRPSIMQETTNKQKQNKEIHL